MVFSHLTSRSSVPGLFRLQLWWRILHRDFLLYRLVFARSGSDERVVCPKDESLREKTSRLPVPSRTS